jgi:predicted DNA-binding transcriptional regulator AlpA
MAADLAGVAEISASLGVSKKTVLRYSRRADFPAPAARLHSGRVWRSTEVSAWARRVLPLRAGRPQATGKSPARTAAR